MSENDSRPKDYQRKIAVPKGGVWVDLTMRIKLIFRLIADPRVNPLLKLLPIGTAVYLLFPDLAPGPIDDVAIIWLGSYLFVELCPPDIVQEHMQALKLVIPGEWQDVNESGQQDDQVVDAEYWDKPE